MRIIIILTVLTSIAFVYSSERGKISYYVSTDELVSTHLCSNVFTKPILVYNNYSFPGIKSTNNGISESNTSLIRFQKPRTSTFLLFLKNHRKKLIFTGIGIITGIISSVFNKKAKSQYDKEKYLYEVYANATKDSDFNTLWNEYKKSADKTDRYLNLRGIFGTSTGVIGVSLLISIAAEDNF